LSKVQELSSLLGVLVVVGGLLGLIRITNLLVLSGSQSSGDIRVGSKFSGLELQLGKESSAV
jgi:hypothetical protein